MTFNLIVIIRYLYKARLEATNDKIILKVKHNLPFQFFQQQQEEKKKRGGGKYIIHLHVVLFPREEKKPFSLD